MFIGPVSLVQGGRGFIIRIPLVIDDEYWGQISIVLDAERYFNIIGEMAASYEYNYVVFRAESERAREVITGDLGILKQDPVLTELNVLNSTLRVGIVPENGWPEYTMQYILSLAVTGVVSLLISFLIFTLIATRRELRVMAIHDSLTGLHNRTFFNNYIKILKAKSDRNGSSAAFLLVDINKFKYFNDTYGHKLGDQVLISIGERFERVLRHSETAFRIGGDEFVICISEAGSREEVLKFVERLHRELSFTVPADNMIIPVSVSIGYALYPDDGGSIDSVLEKADAGMYREKRRSE